MKVYMVTAGEYSDYHVVGIYSTEEIAGTAARISGGDITEVDVDSNDLVVKRLEENNCYDVCMLPNGDVLFIREVDYIRNAGMSNVEYFSSYWLGVDRQRGPAYAGYVVAKDEAHAIKIVNEYRLQHIALGEILEVED